MTRSSLHLSVSQTVSCRHSSFHLQVPPRTPHDITLPIPPPTYIAHTLHTIPHPHPMPCTTRRPHRTHIPHITYPTPHTPQPTYTMHTSPPTHSTHTNVYIQQTQHIYPTPLTPHLTYTTLHTRTHTLNIHSLCFRYCLFSQIQPSHSLISDLPSQMANSCQDSQARGLLRIVTRGLPRFEPRRDDAGRDPA